MKVKIIAVVCVILVLAGGIFLYNHWGADEAKVYKVLSALEIKDVSGLGTEKAPLIIDSYQLYGKDVYCLKDGNIYRNAEEDGLIRGDGKVRSFVVYDGYLYYNLMEMSETLDLSRSFHCYDLKTGADRTVDTGDVARFAIDGGTVVYIKPPQSAGEEIEDYDIYRLSSPDGEPEFIGSTPTDGVSFESIYLKGTKLVLQSNAKNGTMLLYDFDTDEWQTIVGDPHNRNMYSMSFACDDGGFYFAAQRLISDGDKGYEKYENERNGFWYRAWDDEEFIKLSDDFYDELYRIGDALAGIKDGKIYNLSDFVKKSAAK